MRSFFLFVFSISTMLFAIEPLPRSTQEIAVATCNFFSATHSNWLFSPFSTTACLSMLYAGSNGATTQELKQALHCPLSPDAIGSAFHDLCTQFDSGLRLAQGLWIKDDCFILNHFLTRLRSDFHAEIESVDSFSNAIDRMNIWIADRTEQKIQQLFDPSDLEENTRLVAASALYFQDTWLHPFLFHQTALFTTSSGDDMIVDMMSQTKELFYFENDCLQALLLPFRSTHTECVLLLPKSSLSLDKQMLDEVLSSFQIQTVHLEVPKFRIEQRIDLRSLLEEWGVKETFSSSRADFSGIDGRRDLFLNKVFQKCFITFDRKGVEAAAVTGATMNLICYSPPLIPTVSFIADRPFEFLLIDRDTGTVFFIGHVERPESI